MGPQRQQLSSLLHFLRGLLPPPKGQLLPPAVPVSTLAASPHAKLCHVPQEDRNQGLTLTTCQLPSLGTGQCLLGRICPVSELAAGGYNL